MLVIRLARHGRKKYPVYRIVAAEKARAPQGKFVEILGNYNPHTKELNLDKEATLKRIQTGAQPSNTVVKLLQQEKVKLPEWVKLKTRNRPVKKEAEAKPAASSAETTEAAPAAEDSPDGSPAVAEVATRQAADEETADKSPGQTETAADTEAAADAAQASEQAAGEVADEAAKEAAGGSA